jgi:GDP-4-dehydro-6-deoxy-D-mannose reductase
MERKKVAISGVNGFVGQHLAKELHDSGVAVLGIGREAERADGVSSFVDEYYQANLAEEWPDISKADAIIHLAGLANPAESYREPQKYIAINTAILTNLCEHYIDATEKPRIIVVSSGAIYNPDQQQPISEDGEITCFSPYGISKVTNENQAKYYRRRGLDCVIVRPFNHIGPGQANGFILPDFYTRLSTLAEGEKTITTGNIDSKRDYTDVRDIVKAYGKIALARTLKYDTYNICSGKSLSGVEILESLKNAMGLTDVGYAIDKSLVRPTDIMDIRGDSSRIRGELGWEPKIDIQQTVRDFVESRSS